MCKINDGTLVAKVRATGKGKKVELPGGLEIGGKGTDGRKWYEIRKQGKGSWTCSCPAYRFKRGEVGRKSPCKHMLKLFQEWKKSVPGYDEIRIYAPAEL
jgi:hypothetical protein